MPIKKKNNYYLPILSQFSRRDKLQKLLGTFFRVVLFNKTLSAGHLSDVTNIYRMKKWFITTLTDVINSLIPTAAWIIHKLQFNLW